MPSGDSLTQLAEVAHDSFRAFVLDPEFSCVGAKSAIRRGCYRVGVYGDPDTPGSTAGLARDLFAPGCTLRRGIETTTIFSWILEMSS